MQIEMGSCKNKLIDSVCMALAGYDVPINEIKAKLLMLFYEYDISPAEKSLVIYNENKNEILLRQFLMAKTVAGCSQATIRTYGDYLRRILAHIGKDADMVTSEDILFYLAKKMSQGLKESSIDNERRALSSFFSYLTKEEIITKNPMLKIEKSRYHKEPKKAFSDIEIEMMRNALRNNREKAIFELLLSTGCRVSELCSIKIDDLNGEQITVLGKGKKYRNVYINAKAKLAIELYLAERKDENPYLFPKSNVLPGTESQKEFVKSLKRTELPNWYKYPEYVDHSLPMDTSPLGSIIRDLGKRAGVEHAHPHRFRRTCATFALRKGMPVELVSKMLGHANLAITQIYLDLSEEDLRQAHNKYVQ